MEDTHTFNQNLSSSADAALLIWWGIVLLVPPLTIGMGAIGTGLILLGVNAVRLLKVIPTKRATTVAGVIALGWGLLVTGFGANFEMSFALLLIVLGVVSIASLFFRSQSVDAARSGVM